MSNKKRRMAARVIAAILIIVFILALFSSMFQVNAQAATPEAQLQAYANYKVIYVVGDKQIPVGAEAIQYSLVTAANLESVRADARRPSNPGSGKVLCGGIEMELPKELYDMGGYITDVYGNIMISEAALCNYISAVLSPYTTVGKTRMFMTTAGVLRTVGGGNFGIGVDLKTELGFLRDAILTHTQSARIPVMTAGGTSAPVYIEPTAALLPVAGNALYDIGMTYVEIDLTNQSLYYYKDGALLLSTSIVSGDMKRNRATPEGVFYLYSKQRNRTLKGEDYEAFVRYWMPVYGNIGLHDASWRGRFGGSIYQTNGSHGCINMPTAAAKQLYEAAELGTPVVVYY
ncbi:MAG: L,D-transpeptidase [Lachnospiraceae bacterium]|nr:L,D-transpeptidase [Lachnospiraceae bacterium]